MDLTPRKKTELVPAAAAEGKASRSRFPAWGLGVFALAGLCLVLSGSESLVGTVILFVLLFASGRHWAKRFPTTPPPPAEGVAVVDGRPGKGVPEVKTTVLVLVFDVLCVLAALTFGGPLEVAFGLGAFASWTLSGFVSTRYRAPSLPDAACDVVAGAMEYGYVLRGVKLVRGEAELVLVGPVYALLGTLDSPSSGPGVSDRAEALRAEAAALEAFGVAPSPVLVVSSGEARDVWGVPVCTVGELLGVLETLPRLPEGMLEGVLGVVTGVNDENRGIS